MFVLQPTMQGILHVWGTWHTCSLPYVCYTSSVLHCPDQAVCPSLCCRSPLKASCMTGVSAWSPPAVGASGTAPGPAPSLEMCWPDVSCSDSSFSGESGRSSCCLSKCQSCMQRKEALPNIVTCLLGPPDSCREAFLFLAQSAFCLQCSPSLVLLLTCIAHTDSAGRCWGSITTTVSRRSCSRVASRDCQRQAGHSCTEPACNMLPRVYNVVVYKAEGQICQAACHLRPHMAQLMCNGS